MRASYEPTDLSVFTAELASVFRSAIERAGLRYEVDCPALSAPVYVDRDMWEKIVLNLLSNAFKFTLDGHVTVSLGEKDGQAVLRVADTGSGIPHDELAPACSTVSTVRPERAGAVQRGQRHRPRAGARAGLVAPGNDQRRERRSTRAPPSLCAFRSAAVPTGGATGPPRRPACSRVIRRLASPWRHRPIHTCRRRCAGCRRGSDRPGQRGWRPRRRERADRSRRRQRHRACCSPTTTPTCASTCTGCCGSGYQVTMVTDGQAALESARSRPPDLPHQRRRAMLRLDGLELVAALRADPRTADVPVLLPSARGFYQESAIEWPGGLAADDYLVKPFSAAELLARVRTSAQLNQDARSACPLAGRAHRDRCTRPSSCAARTARSGRSTRPSRTCWDTTRTSCRTRSLHPWWPDQDSDPDARSHGRGGLPRHPAAARGQLSRSRSRHRDGRRLWAAGSFSEIVDQENGKARGGDPPRRHRRALRHPAGVRARRARAGACPRRQHDRHLAGSTRPPALPVARQQRRGRHIWADRAEPSVTASVPGVSWPTLPKTVRAALTRLRERPPLTPDATDGGA